MWWRRKTKQTRETRRALNGTKQSSRPGSTLGKIGKLDLDTTATGAAGGSLGGSLIPPTDVHGHLDMGHLAGHVGAETAGATIAVLGLHLGRKFVQSRRQKSSREAARRAQQSKVDPDFAALIRAMAAKDKAPPAP